MTAIVKNEIHFNLSCYEMAKNNLSLAYEYTSAPSRLSEATSASFTLTLKYKCVFFLTAFLLSLRAFSLCIPIANRVTQIALRFLSPKNPHDFINSCPFPPKKSELNIRYPVFIEESFKDKIKHKEIIKSRDLKLSHKMGVLLDKMEITPENYRNTLLNFLAKSPEIKCSDILGNAVALYKKNNQG